MFYLIYFLTILALGLYSFVLVDPNITFIQNQSWVLFREFAVQIGYYNREFSWYVYAILIFFLFGLHQYSIRKYKQINLRVVVIMISGILLASYPFLSHDFFNYMFDARIFTFYGKNPYLFKALDFPADQWTRFMHWTHRTYPYGPVFLLISFIPSILGFGKFSLSFVLFKAMFIGCYALSVYLLSKLNKKWAVIFATHPLIIIEGLVSSHNDLVGLALGIIGVYFMYRKKNILSGMFIILSVGIKYITAPLFALALKHKKTALFVFLLQILILGYMTLKMEIQPWYFLALFVFLPYFPDFIQKCNIFFFGLLMSYYSYIRFGGWDATWKVNIKHQIIAIFFIVNVIFFGIGILIRKKILISFKKK